MELKETSDHVEIVTVEVGCTSSGPHPRIKLDFMIQERVYNTFVKEVKRLKEDGYEQIGPVGYMTDKDKTYLAATLVKPQ